MNVRTTKLYGNCNVYSPDNELMFRCEEKKINWYLSRNLAELISQEPLSIRLNFQPKGKGEKIELLKAERKNMCVVCGEDDLSVLTKHHLVPYEYRKYMPDKIKKNSSMFILPICSSCHRDYETNFSNKLKEKCALDYNTNVRNKVPEELRETLSKLHCLIKHSNKLPDDIKKNMIDYVSNYLSNKINNIDFSDIQKLKEIFSNLKKNKYKNDNIHGKLVIERCKDLSAFEMMWIKDFVDNMKPKYLPDFIVQYIKTIG